MAASQLQGRGGLIVHLWSTHLCCVLKYSVLNLDYLLMNLVMWMALESVESRLE